MKCASKKVELSFKCERAPAKLQPKMHRRTRWSSQFRLRFEIHIESIYREKIYVCDHPSQSPREVVASTTAHRRFMCPGHFWSLGRPDGKEADPGPLQP